MGNSNWTTDNIPDQADKVVIITGTTSGIGKEAAHVLAGKNATVVMAIRNTIKGVAVSSEIRRIHPSATIVVSKLDLSILASVRGFAERFIKDNGRLDVLINNAGIMFCPYSKTDDGFEMQMSTNHLGHYR